MCGFLQAALAAMSTVVGSSRVGRHIDTDDVIDATGMAALLGLSQRNTVSLYQRRYPSMPRPVIDLGQGRCKLWLRSEVEDWRSKHRPQPDAA
jgi:predicted DNA-binding transcriptional regulator AlpA